MVAPYKIEEVKNLSEKVSKAKVVGLVDISNVPSKQFQQMRKNLRKEEVEIKVGKNTILKRAFEKVNLKELSEKVEGSIGIIFTELNPFKLNKILEKNKTYAPAKPGMIAPHDIIISAGDTPLKPGPILGELQNVGIKAQIKGGKIVVTEDSLVAKKGEKISEELANVLSRLNIVPREISLDLKVAYDESGTLYEKDVLKINTEGILSKMRNVVRDAFNLTFNLKIYTSTTIKTFIQNAYYNSLNLALNAEILNKEIMPFLLSRANSQASYLSSRISFPSPEPKVEEVKKEEKEEKPKEEEEEAKKSEPGEEVKEPQREEKELKEAKKPEEEKKVEKPEEKKPEKEKKPAEAIKPEEKKKPETKEKPKEEKEEEKKEEPEKPEEKKKENKPTEASKPEEKNKAGETQET